MVTFVIAQNKQDIFESYLMPGLQRWNAQCTLVTDSMKGVVESIFVKYNAGIEKLKEVGLDDDMIVGFIHEDVKILDPAFIDKVELVFKEKGDVGLLGVVGTAELSETGAWWHTKPENMRGHIIQENGDKAGHLVKGSVGYFDDLVAVDGLCFFIRGSLLINGLRFDAKSYNGYDFYDIDTCLTVLEKGFKVACADILIQHRSIGDVTNRKSWHDARDIFLAKWKAKEATFPLTQKFFFKDTVQTVEV